MIWSAATPSCCTQKSASSIDSTLTPKSRIFPSRFSSRRCSKTSPCLSTSNGTQCNCVRSSASTPSRRNDASVCSRIPAREKLSGQPGGEYRPSFVATYAAPRALGVSAKNFPISVSARPIPYTSAVSKSVVPPSHAARNVPSAASSLTSPQPAPSCHVPKPTSPTLRPVRPKIRVFIENQRAPPPARGKRPHDSTSR